MSDVMEFSARGGLHGVARVPGDKSISHRVVLLAALAEGTSVITGLSDGDDVLRTRAAVGALGAEVHGNAITGGRDRLREPERPIDVGNSGTGMRLIAGVAASLPFLTILIGDASIHRRPMDRVVEPLRLFGAQIDARANGSLAPLCIRGGNLHGIDYATPVPSAQIKGSILFAGLGATGSTTVREATMSRAHSEELFSAYGCPVATRDEGGRHVVELSPRPITPFECDVPGDPSQAAFLVVAATIVPNSEVTIENVYVGAGRATYIDVLLRMGASITLTYRDETSADLTVRSAPLTGTEISGDEVVGLIDEVPILSVAAAFAEGVTTIRDAAELRVKESDRVATTAAGLRAFGVVVEEFSDGLCITGGVTNDEAHIDTAFDHRIAMAFAIGALARTAPTSIARFSAVETSWPGFHATLTALR